MTDLLMTPPARFSTSSIEMASEQDRSRAILHAVQNANSGKGVYDDLRREEKQLKMLAPLRCVINALYEIKIKSI